ncbi:MAG: hypothetical protein WBB23_26135 [Desulforhopalus sp.]
MGDHSIRVLKEGRQRLRGPATNKVGQGSEVFCPVIELRRETPREDALNDHLRHAAKRLGGDLPPFDQDLKVGVRFRPSTVQL